MKLLKWVGMAITDSPSTSTVTVETTEQSEKETMSATSHGYEHRAQVITVPGPCDRLVNAINEVCPSRVARLLRDATWIALHNQADTISLPNSERTTTYLVHWTLR